MSRYAWHAIVVAALLLGAGAHTRAAVPLLHGIAVEETLAGPAALADALPDGPVSVPVVVHLVFEGPASAAALDRLDARVSLYRARRIPVVLVFGPIPSTDADVESWRQIVRAVVEKERGKVAAVQFRTPVSDDPPTVTRSAFLLKQAAIQVRSLDPDILVAVGLVPADSGAWLTAMYAEGVAPYVDAVVVGGPAGDAFRAVDAYAAVVNHEPTTSLWLDSPALSDQPAEASRQLMQLVLRGLGTKVALTIVRASAASLRAALAAAAQVSDVLSGDLVGLDTPVHWRANGADITPQVPSRLLYSQASSDTFLVFGGGSARGEAMLEVDLTMLAPAVRDPIAAAVRKLSPPARAPNTPARLTVGLSDHPLLLDFNYGLAAPTSSAEARAGTLPSVGEIIARYQQVQAAQDAVLVNYLAHLRIEHHLHPTPADPAYNFILENELFFDRGGAEWAQISLSINGATYRDNPPALPLLQPEKVLSLPLELRMTADYRYRLEGTATVNGHPAFVVRFDPVDATKALFRGTIWIDAATYVRLRVAAVETRGTGVVTSSEEDQTYAQAGEIDGKQIWLPTDLTRRQTYLLAGRAILNESSLHLTDIHLNASDFEPRRAAARAGNQVMYRDTEAGVRYLVKKGDARVVSQTQTTSVRAFAMGVDIDPSLDQPLPIVGFDIIDFNFLKRDLQLALLFGGVIAVGNVQHAGMWGGKLDASVDFFGLAVKSNDSVFDAAGERRGERVRTTPFSAGFNVGYRVSPYQKLSAKFEAHYDAYFHDPEASPGFVDPSSTGTLGEGAGYEYRQHGYSVTANAVRYRRTTWQPWGDGTTPFDPATRTYTRYDLGLSKDFVLATFHTLHFNGQYFGGARLDRFSMYQFGLFEPARMHGVPSAVRFRELAMLRGSYSFNVFDQYRLDLFLDQAVGRDSDGWRPVTGLGVGMSFRGPRRTLVRADVGHSLLPEAYRGAGSTVVQIMILKPL